MNPPLAYASPRAPRLRRGEPVTHEPVMVEEVLHYLLHDGIRVAVDGTAGAGGHAAALLEARSDISVIAVDRDRRALELARQRLSQYGERVRFVEGRFSELDRILGRGSLADAVLLDLGVSSMQIDVADRGFSYRASAPLDMRMGSDGETAAEYLARVDADDLAVTLRRFGELPRARRLASAICTAARAGEMHTTAQLRNAMKQRSGREPAPAEMSRLFQAIRIQINGEIEELEHFLSGVLAYMNPGARLVVISYHSLEDRLVKQFMRTHAADCVCPPLAPVCVCGHAPAVTVLTRKVVKPSAAEVVRNSRSRSARLRACAKLLPGASIQ